ncbi:MAG: MarR family transcriptional regulator [Alphaproteobacteria bacterium]|nr:MarR family transcriptional regulator [Alphaproteobacteria bacterium]MBU1560574.1 MarR family transcriptional regulator [Alphaproteobacteria bacterium]MBU2301400.1 MarR family transcriptional regulator [Alphaproteobacteria bacterium]MBU2367353.1 MarR family transcriptional regulator [Alphaproteobacteria bacterium]
MAKKLRSDEADVEPYDALSCTHTSLRRAARQFTQLYDDALAPSGLSSTQALLVAQIDQLGGAPGGKGPSLQALSKRLAIQISALTHALRPLVRDGLVSLHTDAEDRRIKRAVLTEQGMSQTRQMYVLWREVNQRIETVLGDGAAEQLRGLANRVASPDFLAAFGQTTKSAD